LSSAISRFPSVFTKNSVKFLDQNNLRTRYCLAAMRRVGQAGRTRRNFEQNQRMRRRFAWPRFGLFLAKRAGNCAIIARRSAGDNAVHRAISAALRPQPMQSFDVGSSTQTFIHGLSGSLRRQTSSWFIHLPHNPQSIDNTLKNIGCGHFVDNFGPPFS
jgi:hypothetical protein